MGKTTIEWTDYSWNPALGCVPVSPGCKFCYAKRLSEDFQRRGLRNYKLGFEPRGLPERINWPLSPTRLPPGSRCFVCDMSDLFQDDCSDSFVSVVFSVMARRPDCTFQVLSKRAERMADIRLDWPRNVWAGVSVENADYKWRMDYLRTVPASVRFLSCEPLLGSLAPLDLTDIDWVIAGGESGSREQDIRPMNLDWAREIRDECLAQRKPFFFKQVGGKYKVNGHWGGNLLDGREWKEMPPKKAPETATRSETDDAHRV